MTNVSNVYLGLSRAWAGAGRGRPGPSPGRWCSPPDWVPKCPPEWVPRWPAVWPPSGAGGTPPGAAAVPGWTAPPPGAAVPVAGGGAVAGSGADGRAVAGEHAVGGGQARGRQLVADPVRARLVLLAARGQVAGVLLQARVAGLAGHRDDHRLARPVRLPGLGAAQRGRPGAGWRAGPQRRRGRGGGVDRDGELDVAAELTGQGMRDERAQPGLELFLDELVRRRNERRVLDQPQRPRQPQPGPLMRLDVQVG